MIIAQSFKVKNENGFSEEQFLSTTSDLVFMDNEMKENLTYRVGTIQEAITDLEEGLNDEILRAAKAEEDLQKNLDDAIAQEVIDRNAAIKVETDNCALAVQAVDNKINDLGNVLGPKVDAANTAVDNLNTRTTALEESNPTILADINTIKNEIGELDVDESGTVISIATQLANIIARLEVIEKQLNPTA